MKNGERRPRRVPLLGLLPGQVPPAVPLKISRCAENEFDTDRHATPRYLDQGCHAWNVDSGVRNFLFHPSFFPYSILILAIFISSPLFSLLPSHLMCCSLSEVCKLLAVGNQIASISYQKLLPSVYKSFVMVPLF